MTDEHEETLEVEFSSEPSGGQGDLEITDERGESEISDGPPEAVDELSAEESVAELSDYEAEDALLQGESASPLIEPADEAVEAEVSGEPAEGIDEFSEAESVGELSDDEDDGELSQGESADPLIELVDEAVEPDICAEPAADAVAEFSSREDKDESSEDEDEFGEDELSDEPIDLADELGREQMPGEAAEGDDEALPERSFDGMDYDGPEAAAERPVDQPAMRPGVAEPTAESVVEAILFASDEPLTAERLGKIVETGVKQIRKYVESLNEKYAANNNAFRIERIAGGYQMLTLGPYNHWLRKLLRARGDSKLSAAALETLAIIAYKQPIIRADVEAIRGVAAGEMIRGLMYKGLVKIVGRAEVLGRPMLYGTTKRFLEVFGLNSLKDLPKVEELKKPGS